MDALINRRLLEQVSWDSGAPSGTAAVVHRFDTPGRYYATALLGDEVVGEVELAVVAGPEQAATGRPMGANIDLSWIRGGLRGATAPSQRPEVGPEGHVLFSATGQTTGYAVTVSQPEERREVFDTRRLGDGDLFSVTLVRPGRYAVSNTLTGAEGTITVAYPTVGNTPYRPPAPVSVRCHAAGFDPETAALQPAQGVVFRFEVPSRIVINLVEPDDGPANRRARSVRWRSAGA